MTELVQENWIFLVLALVIGLLVAWWLFAGTRRTRIEIAPTENEGAPAKRNQALIDSPATTATTDIPPSAPMGLAGAGEVVQAAAEPVHAAPPSPAEIGDDLTRIKGLGPKLAEQLQALGVTSFAEIAAWNDAEIDRIDAQLGRFRGRIRRDDWPAQARFLASGDTAGYEAAFGRL